MGRPSRLGRREVAAAFEDAAREAGFAFEDAPREAGFAFEDAPRGAGFTLEDAASREAGVALGDGPDPKMSNSPGAAASS